jgi:lipopolysaccharide export system permease protein
MLKLRLPLRLFWYITKEHVAPFFYAFSVITFIMIMQFLIEIMDLILSKGLEPFIVLELFFYNMAWMLALSIPMAVLIAALMAFGRLSADNEITALKSAGISLYTILVPVLFVSAFLAVGLAFFNDYILPEANHKAAALSSDISRKRPAAFIEAGYWVTDFKGFRLLVDRVDRQTGRLYGIKVYQEVKNQPPVVTVAGEGQIEFLNEGEQIRLTLVNGETHKLDNDPKHTYFLNRFTRQVVYFENVDTSLKRRQRRYRGDREMNNAMMLDEVRQARRSMAEQEKVFAAIGRELEHKTLQALPPGAVPDSAAGYRKSLAALDIRVLQTLLRREKDRLRQLQNSQRLITTQGESVNKYMVEVYKKYSIAASCLVFALVGAPLGLMARSAGIMMSAAYSLLFFFIYWIFLMVGERYADRLAITPFWGMWSADILIGTLGIYLIVSLTKETRFISWQWLARPLRRLQGKFRRPVHAG